MPLSEQAVKKGDHLFREKSLRMVMGVSTPENRSEWGYAGKKT